MSIITLPILPEIPVFIAQWLFAVFGLVLGSFFNVLIYRVPRELPIAFPPSHCPQCDARIRPWHNIPVLGWLLLRGRCKDCHSLISIQYPLVEALCGILGWAAIRIVHSDSSAMVDWAVVLPMFWMLITLVPIAAIDFPYQLLPDTVSIGGLLLGFAVCLLPGGIGWLQCVLGVAIAGGGLFVFAWIMGKILKRDAMGFGDIKLLAAFGSMMGPSRAVAALIAAAFLALVVMIPWRTLRRESNSEPLAFGPFIGVMGPVMFLWGDRLIAGYFSLFAQNS